MKSEMNLVDPLTKPLGRKLMKSTSRGMELMPISKVKSDGNPIYMSGDSMK